MMCFRLVKIILITLIFSACNLAYCENNTTIENDSSVAIIKNMFKHFAEALDVTQLDNYYTKDFVLDSNNEQYDYATYKKQQAEIFATLKSLQVIKYEDLFSSGNKVAGRVLIKLVLKSKETHTFHVMFIADIKNNKIDRFWEMTNPSWSDKLPTGK